MMLSSLYITDTDTMGRGVFTSMPVSKDTIIEVSPVIIMTNDERRLLDMTLLHDYIFEWGMNKEKCCMALGYVPVYNHSYRSNCEYIMDYTANNIIIKTKRDIAAGEELFINYNGEWDDDTPLWFDAK